MGINNTDNEIELLTRAGAAFSGIDVSAYSALNLAFIGDSVFDLLVKSQMLKNSKTNQNNNHKRTKKYVQAAAQSEMYHKVLPFLTAEEAAVIKRGRNAKSYTKAKNATISDYRHATGLEALFGYLYIKGDTGRIMEVFNICMDDYKTDTL